MNTQFYKTISDMKTLDNAVVIEAIKSAYVLSERINTPLMESVKGAFFEQAAKYLASAQNVAANSIVIDKAYGKVEFDTNLGSIRSIITESAAIVEVSPFSNEAGYVNVGTTNLTEGIGAVYHLGMKKLEDPAIVESFSDVKNKLKTIVLNGTKHIIPAAVAAVITGCAGSMNFNDTISGQCNDILNRQATTAADSSHLDLQNGITTADNEKLVRCRAQKLAEDYADQVDPNASSFADDLVYDLKGNLDTLNMIYEKLSNGDIPVTSVGLNDASKMPSSFKSGMNQFIDNKMRLNHSKIWKDEKATN